MARSIWKGSIGFGLVNIGVELVSMESPERIDFDLLDQRDMAPIGYRKVNKVTGEEVEPDDIVRGVEVSEGRYVVLSDEEIAEANPKLTRTIELLGFVPLGSVPLPFFAKPYLIIPTKGSEKAYRLLLDALEDTERIAIGEVVVRTRQYTCAVYPHESALVVHLLRYEDELKAPSDLGIKAASARTKPEEAKLARTLVESMEQEWDASAHKDTFRRELMALVKRRSRKGTRKAKAAPDKEAADDTQVLDLVAALKRSVSGNRKSSGSASRSRKSATRSSRKSSRKKSA